VIGHVVKLAKRELNINKNISASQLPIMLILVLVSVIAAVVSGGSDRLLLLCPVLNLFLAMVHFTNIYLQQSKDRELQYLVTIPVEKRDIVIGKIFYVGLVAFLLNAFIHSMLILKLDNILMGVNSLFLSTFIAVVVGMTLLMISFCVDFEKLMRYSQYLRAIIFLAFIASVYLARFDYSSYRDVLLYNPAITFTVCALVIYSYYRLILTTFLRKKSYL